MGGQSQSGLYGPTLSLLRIAVGFAFFLHGLGKIFGFFGGDPVELLTRSGLAGSLELVGGALIILGLFTRPVAFILSGEMAFAYFIAHFPRAALPIENGGEPAFLFCFIFLFFAVAGGGPISLDGLIRQRKQEAPLR